MPDPEVDRAAQFLATHALVLLVCMLAAATSIAAIVWATHLAARYRPVAQRHFAALTNRVQELEIARHLIGRAHGLVPSAYLALHLTAKRFMPAPPSEPAS